MKRAQKEQKTLVILGPTAVGKSALATALARKFNGEVISADSRQVYRGLNIGTGKITKRGMRGVRHHLLDVAEPNRQYSAARYVKAAQRAIEGIARRGKLPIIVGGTGFYIDALLGKIAVPEVPPNRALRARLSKKSAAELFAILQKLDPNRAKTIDRHNPRRLIRAIELTNVLGPISSRHSHILKNVRMLYEHYHPLFIGLTVPKEKLQERIAARLHARLKRGMIAEVRKLRERGITWKRLNDLGLEYRAVAKYLRGNMTKGEMAEKLRTEIWHYAKRQMTWFKRNAQIQWFTPSQAQKIETLIRAFLKN